MARKTTLKKRLEMYEGMQLQNYLPDLKKRQYGIPFKEDLVLSRESNSISTLNPSGDGGQSPAFCICTCEFDQVSDCKKYCGLDKAAEKYDKH